tara:strand:+ start:65 stop:217 length:153 start_codon:yes stop_codon:yes gene_type:complete
MGLDYIAKISPYFWAVIQAVQDIFKNIDIESADSQKFCIFKKRIDYVGSS